MSRISSRVRRSPSTSACEEVADQVVARSPRALVDDPLEVRVDRIRGLALVRLGLGVAELVADDVVGPDDAVLHPQEDGQLLQRQPEQGEEHLRRERHRELLREVDLAARRRSRRSGR